MKISPLFVGTLLAARLFAAEADQEVITEIGRTDRVVELSVRSDNHPVPGPYQVKVYLPPDYSARTEACRVFYVFDGYDLSVEHDALWQEGLIHPAIFVSIQNKKQSSRFYDLTPTRVPIYPQGTGGLEALGDLIVGRIKPYIDARYRTLPGPEGTGVVGNSLGGLSAFWLGYHRPATFGLAACLEPSLWWNNRQLLRQVQQDSSPKSGTRFWIMSAELGVPSMCRNAKRAAYALAQRGWTEGEDLAFFQVHNGSHGWGSCRAQLRDMLHFLLRKTPPKLTGAALTNRHGPQKVPLRLRETGESAFAYLDLQWENGVRTTAIAPDLQVADPKVAKIEDQVLAQLLPVGPGWTTVSATYCGFEASLPVEGFQPEGYERLSLKPAPKLVVVDGNLGEWDSLPFEKNDGDGHSAGFRFGLTYDADFVYLAVRVNDEALITKAAFRDRLDQDGLEISVDARPDPVRSLGRGEERFFDFLTLQMTPGETVETMKLRRQKESVTIIPDGLRAACVRTPDGYAAEVAIPVAALDRAQRGPWKEFRFNIYQADVDVANGPVRRIAWQPAWESAEHVIASGTFSKAVVAPDK